MGEGDGGVAEGEDALRDAPGRADRGRGGGDGGLDVAGRDGGTDGGRADGGTHGGDRADGGGRADGGAISGRAAAVYVLLVLLAAYVLVRNLDSPNDYANFIPFGLAALAGRDPYTAEMVARFGTGPLWSTWPPSFAPVAAALALLDGLLGGPATIFLWQGANLLGLAVLLAACARWIYGRALALRPGPDRLPVATMAALAGLLVPFRLVLSNFEHTQSNLLFLGLAAGGIWLLDRGRRWTGGLSVGLATAFKATPLLLLPWLAWRGRWRDLGASLAGCGAAWLVLPGALLGPAEAARWYGDWARFVGSLPLPLSGMNQSLQATVARLAGAGAGPSGAESAAMAAAGSAAAGSAAAGSAAAPAAAPVAGPGTAAHVFGGALGAPGTVPLVLGVAGVVVVLGVVGAGRPGRAVSRRRAALELGVVFAAMALFAPVAWKHHFAALVPLAAALWSRTPVAPGRVAGDPAPGSPAAVVLYGGLGAAALAINGTATGLVGAAAADRFERTGVVTLATLLLVGLAIWLLWRERSRRRGAPP